MIKFVTGSIFDSSAQALINTVNCEGVMGKGLALQFKKKFKNMYMDYVRVCSAGELRPGKLHTFVENRKFIINFPTKDTWRRKSKMQYIEDGLNALVQLLKEQNIKSVAIPPLGAGNGGLDWAEVKKVILDKLTDISAEVDIYIYEPMVKPVVEEVKLF